MKEVREIIRFWEARRGQPLALVTLVAVKGSSYRRPGARMMIDIAGESVGSVSAGCIEDEVIGCARESLGTGVPQLMTFDTRRRFGCHGTIEVFVEVAADEVMAELRDCQAQRRSCRLETLVDRVSRGTRIAAYEDVGGCFVQTVEPVLRLILIGDSSDTVALHAQAALLGWNVLQYEAAPLPPDMIDDRTAVRSGTEF
jgi:xanthine dehydrogenase accessory factor